MSTKNDISLRFKIDFENNMLILANLQIGIDQ